MNTHTLYCEMSGASEILALLFGFFICGALERTESILLCGEKEN
jgi:hypothetical protein